MKILVAAAFGEAGLKLLLEKHQVEYAPKISQTELKKIIGDFDAIVSRGTCPVREDVIRLGTRLQVIATAGAGTNHIDVEFARSRGIKVINASGANAYSVAELTLGLLLSLLRRVPEADREVKLERIYDKNRYLGREAAGKTLGLIGIGQIGFKVAKVCQSMEMRVLAYDPYVRREIAEDAGIELADLESVFARSDVISVHVPLTEETRGVINAKNLALTRPGSYVINMSRGEIADEAAVAEALNIGQLAGYATDVICQEPAPGEKIQDRPLLDCGNLVITPHMGAWTVEAQEKATLLTAQRVLEAFMC